MVAGGVVSANHWFGSIETYSFLWLTAPQATRPRSFSHDVMGAILVWTKTIVRKLNSIFIQRTLFVSKNQ